jgi:hypothetical protein
MQDFTDFVVPGLIGMIVKCRIVVWAVLHVRVQSFRVKGHGQLPWRKGQVLFKSWTEQILMIAPHVGIPNGMELRLNARFLGE